MEHTGNFQLSQWESTDRIQRQDFNADNAKIDAALAALTAASAGHGNCRMCCLTHTGTGTHGEDNPTRFYFPWKPDLIVVVRADRPEIIYGLPGAVSSFEVTTTTNITYATITWSGGTATIIGTAAISQFNLKNEVYYVFGFGIKT